MANLPDDPRDGDRRGVAGVLFGAILASISLVSCNRAHPTSSWGNGDPACGATTAGQLGCGSCHEIPGVANSDGLVGPSLAHFGRHTMIAGLLPNTQENLVLWLRHPQAVVPGNAMPDMGLSEAQARDIAAYLHSLD